jgi:cation:H+ antiporter
MTSFLLGLALLVIGGEFVVRGSVHIARQLGMSELLVGLTVVAFGTSAPELAICLDAVVLGKPEIALGNIVGSNIANVLLILGLTATLYPVVIHRQIVQREVPIMIAVSVLFLLLCYDGILGLADGLILLGAMVMFLIWQIRSEHKPENMDKSREGQNPDISVTSGSYSRWLSFAVVFVGIACLWFGAGRMVMGASGLAESLGVSKLIVGLTVVAVGSSAPEIVTALMAAKRGFPELAVGSVIGSNIFNLLFVGGGTILFSPNIAIPNEAFQFDIPVMVVSSIACLPIFATGHRIDRWEGVIFLVCFAAFTVLLFVKPDDVQAFPTWAQLVWPFVTPLILATGLAVVTHKFRRMNPIHVGTLKK